MDLKQRIAMNLRYYRYQEGLSQEKYYSLHNLSVKYLANCERALVNLTIENIEEIAKNLGITVDDLLVKDKSRLINKKRIDEKNNQLIKN